MNKREFLKGTGAMAAMGALHGCRSHGVPRENWAGNVRYSTDRVLQPASAGQVRQAVLSLNGARALGTRHSFNRIADSTLAQISTLGLNGIRIDPAAKTATVGAGVKYGDLAVEIDRAGFALPNLASLPHISVGGAVATGTHGSGLRNGSLATSVSAVEFVSPDGALHSLSRERDGDRFSAVVVSLGSLGVVTRLTLELEPSYRMSQVVYRNLSFDVLKDNFEAVMGTGYSLSLFTNWQNNQAWEVWIKRRLEQGGAEPPAKTFFGATLAAEKLHPVLGQDARKTTDQLNLPGKWYERLPHFKMEFTPSTGREIQTEYLIPFESAYPALRAVESLRDQITPHLLVTEIRAVAADDLWMSMAYQRRSLAIHFTWKPEPEAVLQVIPQIEARLKPFGPRPHWAKVNTMRAAEIAPLYPRFEEFRKLVGQYDPEGKFRNAYMEEKLLA